MKKLIIIFYFLLASATLQVSADTLNLDINAENIGIDFNNFIIDQKNFYCAGDKHYKDTFSSSINYRHTTGPCVKRSV
jgi:hypothetical protein